MRYKDKIARAMAINAETIASANNASLADMSQQVSQMGDINAMNLITNGNFSNGTVGWNAPPADHTVSTSNGDYEISRSDTVSTCSIMETVAINANSKIYVAFNAKASLAYTFPVNVLPYIGGCANQSLAKAVTTTYQRFSTLFTPPSAGTYIALLSSASLPVGTTFYFNYIMAIDLTATFGAGNEPSQAQCDAMMLTYNNSWFNGIGKVPTNGNNSTIVADETLCNGLLDLQSANSLSVIWSTDNHYAPNNAWGYNEFQRMICDANAIGADLVLNTGDITNGYSNLATEEDVMYNILAQYKKSLSPVAIVKGNHDDNSWYTYALGINNVSEVFNSQTWYSRAIKPFINQYYKIVTNANDPNGGYCYIDYPTQKIRVICLNDYDYPYLNGTGGTLKYGAMNNTVGQRIRQAQYDWVANTALQFTATGWGVVIATHMDLKTYLPQMWNVIVAFSTNTSVTITDATVDFTLSATYNFASNSSNEVIAEMYGHDHIDSNCVNNGILCVELCSMQLADSAKPAFGWDSVVINRDNKTFQTRRWALNTNGTTVRNALLDRNLTYTL